jgi:hypothetical protein
MIAKFFLCIFPYFWGVFPKLGQAIKKFWVGCLHYL